MSTSHPSHLDPRAEQLATWSAVFGAVITLSLAAASGSLLLAQRTAGATSLGAVGQTVALTAPFVASLVATRLTSTDLQRAVWLSCGVLALVLGGLTVFSGVGFFIIAAAVGLLAAWWLSRDQAGVLGSVQAIAVSVWLMLSFGGAFAGQRLRETPACWDSGGNGWVASDTANECRSDIVDDTEGGLALAGVVAGFGGLALLSRRRRADQLSGRGPGSSLPASPDHAPSVPRSAFWRGQAMLK
jgi:hypothetical protein